MQNPNNETTVFPNMPVGDVRVGTVKFGTDIVDGKVYGAFPTQIFVHESIDAIEYDQVLEYFTNEDMFFCLTPALLDKGRLEAANQRCQTTKDHPEQPGRVVNALIISLAGRIVPSDVLMLKTNAMLSGHLLETITQGTGSTCFTQITLYLNVEEPHVEA